MQTCIQRDSLERTEPIINAINVHINDVNFGECCDFIKNGSNVF